MTNSDLRERAERLAKLTETAEEAPDHEWQPIESLPTTGQALVTDDDPDDGDGYGCIELVNCPMLPDGRVMNQNSGNYSRAGTWKWWRPVPKRAFVSGYRNEWR